MTSPRPGPSPFDAQWRACQREHYKHAVRHGSAQRRAATADAMRATGVGEAELSELYLQATMHVDDVPDDFVPDLATLERERLQRELQPHPDECACPSCRVTGPGSPQPGSEKSR